MGMAATQVRLLALTSRSHDIELKEQQLSNQKIALSRDMQKVSKNYQNALNSKVLKWTNNQGVSCTDLSYNILMTPNTINQSSPYLITDEDNKVVIDSKYKKYAEMISADGSANGDYESNRSKILSSLTGIDESKIAQSESYSNSLGGYSEKMAQLKSKEPEIKSTTTSPEELLKKVTSNGDGVSFSSGSNWAEAYDKCATIDIGSGESASKKISQIFTHLSNSLEKYFPNDESFNEDLETICSKYTEFLKSGTELTGGGVTGSGNNYKINVKDLINEMLANNTIVATDGKTYKCTWYDVDSSTYQTQKANHDAWEKEYKALTKEYDSTVDSANQVLSSEQETQIEFYDAIFSSIAENGWTYNNGVEDNNYLNQMLQNNIYTITTVNRDKEYDSETSKYSWNNNYTTDIASNMSKITTVNNSDAATEAYTEYEYQKSIINAKESRIDQRMKNLETELSAIKQMIQGAEAVRNKNIETFMNIFG